MFSASRASMEERLSIFLKRMNIVLNYSIIQHTTPIRLSLKGYAGLWVSGAIRSPPVFGKESCAPRDAHGFFCVPIMKGEAK